MVTDVSERYQRIRGRVSAANERGLLLEGQPSWFNYTKHRTVEHAHVGELVDLWLEGIWINRLEHAGEQQTLPEPEDEPPDVDEPPPPAAPPPSRAPSAPAARTHELTPTEVIRIRIGAIHAASAFYSNRPELMPPDLFRLARNIEAWIHGDEAGIVE